MAVYECFFFSDGMIQYWENIAVRSGDHLVAALRKRLFEGEWTFAEAWLGEALVCRVDRSMRAYRHYAA